MSDWAITANGDIEITDGDFRLVTGDEAVAQDIAMSLRTFLAESVYDRNAGVPWLQIIFVRGTTLIAIRFIIERALLAIDGVTEVLELTTELARAARSLTVTGKVRVNSGAIIPIAVQVEP